MSRPARSSIWLSLLMLACCFLSGFLYFLGFRLFLMTGNVPWYLPLSPVFAAVAAYVIALQAQARGYLMLPAFAVQAGLLSFSVLSARFSLAGPKVLIECLAVGVGLILLIAIRHWWPAALLIAYQSMSTALGLAILPSLVPGSGDRTLGLMVVTFRSAAAVLMIVGLARNRAYGPKPAHGQTSAAEQGAPVTAAGAAAGAVATSQDKIEELRRLAALASEGVITREEHETKKRQIVGI